MAGRNAIMGAPRPTIDGPGTGDEPLLRGPAPLVLEKLSWYREASDELRSEIRSSVVETRIPQGSHFYLEGDRCAGFAIVGAGRLRVYKSAETGREITLYEVREGETCIVSTLSVILEAPVVANAVADIGVEALLVPPDTFRRWVREQETVRDLVLRALAQRMVDVITLVEEVAFRRLDRRVAGHLLHRLERDGPDRDGLELTHQVLAVEMGATREAISRILGDLERRGAVALTRGRITLTDPARLRDIADGGG